MPLGSIRDQVEEIQTERQIPIFERDGQRIPVAQVGRQPQHKFQRIMNDLKVKRQELLTKVRANRDAHRSLFLLAQEGYRKLVIEELDKMLTDARAGLPIKRSASLTEPSDHTKDYDRVIAMLEMSVDDTITLEAQDFDQYVMDNWDWSRFALSTNTLYAAEAPRPPTQ